MDGVGHLGDAERDTVLERARLAAPQVELLARRGDQGGGHGRIASHGEQVEGGQRLVDTEGEVEDLDRPYLAARVIPGLARGDATRSIRRSEHSDPELLGQIADLGSWQERTDWGPLPAHA